MDFEQLLVGKLVLVLLLDLVWAVLLVDKLLLAVLLDLVLTCWTVVHVLLDFCLNVLLHFSGCTTNLIEVSLSSKLLLFIVQPNTFQIYDVKFQFPVFYQANLWCEVCLQYVQQIFLSWGDLIVYQRGDGLIYFEEN